MRIWLSPEAEADLQATLEFIRERNPTAAIALASRVFDTLDRIYYQCREDSLLGFRMNSDSNSSAGRLPSERPVLLLDYLLRIRKDMLAGRLAMHIGEPNVEHLVGFVNGYHSCLISNDINDEEYSRFFEWLRDVKKEFPGEGWAAKYLRDCNGDHEQAIRKHLDFVAEFIALHRR